MAIGWRGSANALPGSSHASGAGKTVKAPGRGKERKSTEEGAPAGAFCDSKTGRWMQPRGCNPIERNTMTDKNRGLRAQNEGGAIDRHEVRTDLDPIAIVMEPVSDDPSVAELVAFRDAVPDLKLAAREAKRLDNEAMRVRLNAIRQDVGRDVAAGLALMSLSFAALTAIWPSDTLAEVEAKLALAEATGPYGDDQDGTYVPALEPATATRIRVKRAAYNAGELMVPAAPASPSAADRGLADWPLRHYDLTTILPPAGGPPLLGDAQAQRVVALLGSAPDLFKLAERVERLLKTADRLFALAHKPEEGAAQLRRAAEGAQLLAYLTAAQAAIWPARKDSEAAKAKRRVAKAIDDRACRGDPLNMQAAVRMTFEDASWLARYVDAEAHIPTWIEIV